MEDKKEDNNCSDTPKHPGIPANYVSLLQLQQRWLKEKERKQKEDEALGAVSAPQKSRDVATRGGNRSNLNRINRYSTVTSPLTVEANAVVVTVDDHGSKNVDGSSMSERETGKHKRVKNKKKKKKKKEVVQKEVESAATSLVVKDEKAQEKRVKGQIQWRAVKNEKESVGPRIPKGRRAGEKAKESDGTVVVVEPKNGNVSVGKKDEKVGHNRDVDNLAGQKIVEIKQKNDHVSIKEEDEKVEKPNKGVGRRIGEHRNRNRNVDYGVGQKMVEIKPETEHLSTEEKNGKVEEEDKVVGQSDRDADSENVKNGSGGYRGGNSGNRWRKGYGVANGENGWNRAGYGNANRGGRRRRENIKHNRNVDDGVGQKMVEIKPESEDASTEEKIGNVEEEDKVVGHSSGDADRENVKNGSGWYRGHNGGNRWREGYGIANRDKGWNRAGYGSVNHGGNRSRTKNGMVWVKKGEIGYGGQVTNCGSS